MSKECEAREYLERCRMRRRLLDLLWEARRDARGETPRPSPCLNDEWVTRVLKELLRGK